MTSKLSYGCVNKTLIVLFCTALSAIPLYGIVALVVDGGSAAGEMNMHASILAWVMAYAWFCYFLMSGAWIISTQIRNKWWPISGTVSALLPLFVISIETAFEGKSVLDIMMAFFTPMVFALPSILLAIWLVRYHLKKTENNIQP